MADIFRKTLLKREEEAGTKVNPNADREQKNVQNQSGSKEKLQMSQADFLYGVNRDKGSQRPPMSRKWIEKINE